MSKEAALAGHEPTPRQALRERAVQLEFARLLLRPGSMRRCVSTYLRALAGSRAYPTLSEDELRATRKSDTVFIFGSGRSILDIAPEEWRRIEAFDTISFSQFHRERLIRIDYHIVGETFDVDEYARSIRENPFYAETILAVQKGLEADASNDLLGRRLVPTTTRVFPYRRVSRGRYSPPSTSFEQGLVHGRNSSISTTNFALLLGWRRIVLCGVDLYDKHYFFLPEDGSRPWREKLDIKPDDVFPNAEDTVSTFRQWRPIVEGRGVELLVYNPRSLLAGALDVFSWTDA
jgi:hypothetical protein